MRRLIRRGGALALILVVAIPGFAQATGPDAPPASSTLYDEPSIALDADDTTHLAYIGYGDAPGIYFATDATDRWVSTRLTTVADDAPAIAIDAEAKNHIVFARYGADPGIFYATDRSGAWVVTRLSSEQANSPSIAVDPQGHVHIAFDSDSARSGVITLDDTSGDWVRTQVTDAPNDGATAIAVMPDGSSKIAFARYAPDAPGIYVASAPTSTAGPWTLDRLTTAYDDDPSIVVRSPSEIDVAFARFQTEGRGLYYATGPRTWSVTPLTVDDTRYFGRPSMAIDQTGRATIVYALLRDTGEPYGLYEARQAADGSWATDLPLNQERRPDDWASLALDTAGREHIAFAELDTGPIPGVYVRDPVKFDLVAGSTLVDDATIAEVDDQHVVTVDPSTGGSTDASTPAIVVDAAWNARLASGDVAASSTAGVWARSILGLYGHDVRASIDAKGHRWLAFQGVADVPTIATDSTGVWQTATNHYGYPGLGALAVGPDGRIHWVIAGDTLAYQTAPAIDGPWDERSLGDHATDPAIVLDADGHAHIVWRRTTSDEGIYYATDASGTWQTTRLTRTSAEGAPSLALDADGHVWVAVVRGSSSASPGLYLLSNRTGTWVTSRVDGSFDDLDPRLSIDATGRPTIVLGRDGATLAVFDQPDFRAGALPAHLARDGAIDLRDPRSRGGSGIDRSLPAGGAAGTERPATVPDDHRSSETP